MCAMELTDFGKKLTGGSGILQLMDDLGKPLAKGIRPYPLGGGNPARVPEVEKAYMERMEALVSCGAFGDVISRYDSPQGRMSFIETVATYFRNLYGWDIDGDNVAVTNGSQSAMFYLFNMFSGTSSGRKKTILFPLMPEYVGYADQGIEEGTMVSIASKCTVFGDNTFKYTMDIEAVSSYMAEHPEVGAICVSRPTNPSGNVLTDDEIHELDVLAKRYSVPLIIDNAYGLPFPDIVFIDEATPVWNENIILSMSLSKIGLPSIRTGIIIASKEIVSAISGLNAIAALASGSMGQALAEDLIGSGRLVRLAREHVMPFYRRRKEMAEGWIRKYFDGLEYMYHRIEGSIFCWLYLPRLRIPAKEFYAELKKTGVITVPGEYFFFGSKEQEEGRPYPHPHYDKCLRINYSGDEESVEEGIRRIAAAYRAQDRDVSAAVFSHIRN